MEFPGNNIQLTLSVLVVTKGHTYPNNPAAASTIKFVLLPVVTFRKFKLLKSR